MRVVIISVLIALFLTSCVNTQPFYVGEDVDAQNQLKNITKTVELINKMASQICPFVQKGKVAVVDFIKYKESQANGNGRFLAYQLTKALNKHCLAYAEYLQSPDWFNPKDLSISYFPKDYDYIIVGSYRYLDKIFFVYASLIDTRLESEIKTFNFKMSIKKVRFSLEPLNIPYYWEFP
ncbi:hypothetical protein [Hippea alviniae]|uniref:hypothetical protein n=1 Tax=Hippea alviniae TaxID=1279027 RepID=UPI0003B48DF4|nr:hypothetical protein [Hippea alviniae]